MRTIIGIGYIVLVVLVGILSKSIWVSVMVGFGYIMLTSYKMQNTGIYLFRLFCGIGLIGGAVWLAQFAGRWIWVAVFLLASLSIFTIGAAEQHLAKKWRTPFQMGVGFLVLIFGALSPYLAIGDLRSDSFLGWLLVMFLIIMIPFLIFVMRDSSRNPGSKKWIPRLLAVIVLGMCIIAWFATKVIWVPFLILIGLFLGFRNYQRWLEGALFQYKTNLLEIVGGMILVGVASFFANLEPWWFWVIILVIISIPPLAIGSFLYDEEDKGMARGGRTGLILCAIGLIFALIGPFMLNGMEVIPALITFLLIAGGALLLVISWDGATVNKLIQALLLGILGTAIFVEASIYSGFAGGWVWVVLWLFGALLMVAALFSIRSIFGKLMFLLLAGFHGLAAFRGPQLVQWFMPESHFESGGAPINWSLILLIIGGIVLVAVIGFLIFMISRDRQMKKTAHEIPSLLTSTNILKYMLGEEEQKRKKK